MKRLTPYNIVNNIVLSSQAKREIEKYRKEYTSFHSIKSLETAILNDSNFNMAERMRIFFEVAAYLFGISHAEDALSSIVNTYNNYSEHFGCAKNIAMEAMYGRK